MWRLQGGRVHWRIVIFSHGVVQCQHESRRWSIWEKCDRRKEMSRGWEFATIVAVRYSHDPIHPAFFNPAQCGVSFRGKLAWSGWRSSSTDRKLRVDDGLQDRCSAGKKGKQEPSTSTDNSDNCVSYNLLRINSFIFDKKCYIIVSIVHFII